MISHSLQKNVHSKYKRISRMNSIKGRCPGLLFFSDRREEKQGQPGEASAAASQG